MASSSSCGWVEGWLRRHGIRDLLDVVVARDDVTRVKPDPELFLLAARRLEVAPAACVVFEDSPNGMRAALAAGMRCVAVPNALTRSLERPEVDLVMASLDERPLAAVLEAVTGAQRPRLSPDPESAPGRWYRLELRGSRAAREQCPTSSEPSPFPTFRRGRPPR